MANIVVLGAGLGGTLVAFELLAQLRPDDTLTLIGQGSRYHFVPSNPWVAVGWRTRTDIEVGSRRRHATQEHAPVWRRAPSAFIRTANAVETEDGATVAYDYLVVATGPDLAFDEIPGSARRPHPVDLPRRSRRAGARGFRRTVQNSGPVVVGAVQGASCFGPAYEFAFILDTELRHRRLRDRVPMTFVTAEPYIGHLGLDGVGDTKGLLESEFRNRHIKWITNARVASVAADRMHVEEIDDDGALRKTHDLPFAFAMMLPAFRGVAALRGLERLTNPRGFVLVDKHQRNPPFPNVFAIGVCVAIPPVGPTPVPVGVPKTGFMIESMVTATAVNIGPLLRGKRRARRRPGTPSASPISATAASPSSPSRKSRRATSTGRRKATGCIWQSGIREVFPAQDPQRRERTVLRASVADSSRHPQAQGNGLMAP